MNLYQNIEAFIAHHALIKCDTKIIVGLSGGPDSVFLLYFLVSLRNKYSLTFIAAHLNHEWRPESDQEQELCRNLAHKLAIPFITKKRSEFSIPFKQNGSQEEYGRKLRRYFFEKVANEYNANTIALAHHAQDQEETFFIRLIRGSSLSGLTGIKAKNGMYIRPLLEINKSEIVNWLHNNDIIYAMDTSNESLSYLRNRIRLTVLPALRSCDKRFETNFLTTLNRLKATELFLEDLTKKTFEEISFIQDTHFYIHIPQFLAIDRLLQHRIVIHWFIIEHVPFSPSEAYLNEVIRFINNPHGGKHEIHTQWSLIKEQKTIVISRNNI
ncbi:MAG TPA: tRNA lysidine(34) synthetase TilS [Candidatus Babeliales bacterium]|nr:tRNA lysidine(34) synthetase TilS [Candidatus Babeliales bacterium]